MNVSFWFCALILAAGALGQEAAAQRAPLKGMVWQAPADGAQARQELLQMHRMGVEAVRTGLLHEEGLLEMADTLGLQLFQELPYDRLPAAELVDKRLAALDTLKKALQRAQAHPSARHFGLSRRSDTSDPRACNFFRQLTDQARAYPGSQTYYVGVFVEADRCAGDVDFVLLDLRDAPDPVGALIRWRAAPGTSVRREAGIGALGTWVARRGAPGLRDPHSPESQARYLETHLRKLFVDTTAPAPRAVFVYRWRDVRSALPSPAYDLSRPYEQGYGIYTGLGVPRPARDVVEGFFTGRQTVFAFPAGEVPVRNVPWFVLIGWLVFTLIAVSYALSPRFRYMVPRYFQAHGFYREAIREGRDVLLGVSVVMLVALALSAGVLGGVVLDVARREPAFQVLYRALPEPVQSVGVALLAQPWMLVLLLSSFYALGVALWTSMLSFASRRRQPLIPGQALMLVLWVRWTFLPLMAGAMVVPSLPEGLALPVAVGLAAGWLLAACYAIARTLIDYAAITYVPAYWVLVVGLLNPLVLIVLAAGLVSALDLAPALAFCWHLATRS